jgi:hypothetical protein
MKSDTSERDHLSANRASIPEDADLLDLEQAYQRATHQAGDVAAFAEMLAAAGWQDKSPAFIKRAIEMTLHLELVALARRLADYGRDHYPGNPYFSNIAVIIAPPRVLNAHLPPVPGVSASMEWLNRHAGEYRGQWIALRGGQLLGADSSRQKLVKKLGDGVTRHETLITRIP